MTPSKSSPRGTTPRPARHTHDAGSRGSTSDLDAVFRALADPTRRGVLDLLREGPRTTGDLCEQFPHLSRYAVMKHLTVLADAGLLIVSRNGSKRWNAINPVPLRALSERWLTPFAALWGDALTNLKRISES